MTTTTLNPPIYSEKVFEHIHHYDSIYEPLPTSPRKIFADSGDVEYIVPLDKVSKFLNDRMLESYFKIEKVIFNNPATIVYWKDGTKTVVKCGKDDTYSEETGLALCFMKKALGNKGNYNNTFKKYIKENKDGKDNDNKSK